MEAIILILTASIFFTGIIGRVKSIAAGRKGPGILQPMRDIARNLRKGPVYGETTGIIFRIAPAISLATLVTAALCVPLGSRPGLLSFQYDFVFFIYLKTFKNISFHTPCTNSLCPYKRSSIHTKDKSFRIY
mgnify:CR=1 FL=1